MVKKIAAIVLVGLVALVGWLYFWVHKVSGDEFQKLVIASDASSYSSWYLYEQSDDYLCFKYSRPVVPKKYCVPRNELEVLREGRALQRGYVRNGEFALKEGRYPGAKRVVF